MSKQEGTVDKDGYFWPRWYLDWKRQQEERQVKALMMDKLEQGRLPLEIGAE